MPADSATENPAPALLQTASADAMLLEFLKHHDALCPLCKYNLRNLTQPRCPECGCQVKLSVGAAEPYLGPWIALASGVCMPAGIGVFFSTLTTTFFVRHLLYPGTLYYGPPLYPTYWSAELILGYAAAYYCVSAIPSFILSLVFRRRFMRLSKPIQRAVGCGAWAINLLLLITFLCLVR